MSKKWTPQSYLRLLVVDSLWALLEWLLLFLFASLVCVIWKVFFLRSWSNKALVYWLLTGIVPKPLFVLFYSVVFRRIPKAVSEFVLKNRPRIWPSLLSMTSQSCVARFFPCISRGWHIFNEFYLVSLISYSDLTWPWTFLKFVYSCLRC